MAKEEKIELEGTVIDALKGSKFLVKLNDNGAEVTCTISGRIRQNNIRILRGDNVKVSISPYSLQTGIIIWRSR